MDADSAQAAAKIFVKGEHRHEGKFSGKIARWWDNRPETLYKTLVSIFQMANSLFDYHSVIFEELLLVASRIKMIAGSVPDRPIENNSWFWFQVLDQVNDVFLGAGTQYRSAAEITIALRSIPNFETNEYAKQHLAIIRSTAHQMLWTKKASQRVVMDSSPTGASSADPPASPPGVQIRPDRRHQREDDRNDRHDPDTDTGNVLRDAFERTDTSEESCAVWCSLAGCRRDDCRFAHRLPVDRRAADRLYSIILRKRLSASPELLALCSPPELDQTIDDSVDTSSGPGDRPPAAGRRRKRLRAN